MEFFGYFAAFLMGITLGVMGGGGSILTVPIMVYLFSISPAAATGYSLFVVGMTALIGSLIYIRRGDIDFTAGISFAIPSVIGVNVSRGLIMPNIPGIIGRIGHFTLTKEILIMAVFAALMALSSRSMIKKQPAPQPPHLKTSAKWIKVAIRGLVVGLIAGFVGAGGGFLIIPALVLLTGLPMRIAIGTSLMIISVQSLLGFAGDIFRGFEANWHLLSFVTAIAAVGIVAGSSIVHKVNERSLKTAFGWFVLFMGTAIFIEQISHLII